MASYTYPKYAYIPPPELVLKPGGPQTVPVLIVGAGPVGLTLALDLALKGVPVTVLDEDDTVSLGSRSICQAKRTLEIWHRLGVADRMVAKGVTWDQGEVLLGDQPLYRFNLQPEPGHRFPAFINLQQYYCEQYLVERCLLEDKIDLRFLSKAVGVRPDDDHVEVDVQTPDGVYQMRGQWLVACDGVRSPVRTMLGLPYEGEVFDDQFLIADIRMTAELPKIRRYWFYPPFHPTDSVLLHRQADEVLRNAQRILEQIRVGTPFAAMAQQFSQSASAAAGGDLGWVLPGQFDPALEAAIAKLQPGRVTEQPVRSAAGWHILALVDRRTFGAAGSSNPAEIRVSVVQLLLPLPANARQDEIARGTAEAQKIIGQVTKCADLRAATRECRARGPALCRVGRASAGAAARITSAVADIGCDRSPWPASLPRG